MTSRITHRALCARLGTTIRLPLCKLNEIQFSAPWNPRRRAC